MTTATLDWALIEKNVGEALCEGDIDDSMATELEGIIARRDVGVFCLYNESMRSTGLDLLNYDREAAGNFEDLTVPASR